MVHIVTACGSLILIKDNDQEPLMLSFPLFLFFSEH